MPNTILSQRMSYINSVIENYKKYKSLFENPITKKNFVNYETAKLYTETTHKLLQLSINQDFKAYIEEQLGHDVNDIPVVTMILTNR